MTHFVIDTHVWVWAIYQPEKVPAAAQEAIANAERVTIPTVCIYEIGQKVRLRKWDGMSPLKLDQLLVDAEGRFQLCELNPDIARRASLMALPHRDTFDRIIAATALELAAPLISRDPSFDAVTGLERLWTV